MIRQQRFLLPALLALTVVRFLFLPLHELSATEIHALECSRQSEPWHPALGPLLPLLVKAGTGVCGAVPFGVRLFAPLLMLGAAWLLWDLTRGMFDATTASWVVAVFNVTPAVNIASVTMTLTTVGTVASIGVLAALRHALHREHRFHLHWWQLGGTLVLGFLADWRLVMLTVSVVASMALTARGRRALMKWPVLPVLSISVGVVLTFFLAWNSEHGWVAFAPMPPMQSVDFSRLLLHALLAVSPLLLAAHGWCLATIALRRPMEYTTAFLYAFIWPLVSLDILTWNALPWPHCGFGAWLAPAGILLARQSLADGFMSPRAGVWTRWTVLTLAAAQSCWMLHRGLPHLPGMTW